MIFKHKIGEIEFHKGGWSYHSGSGFFPSHFPTFWIVKVPILKSEEKKGDCLVGLPFSDEGDAETFSDFLKVHLKKYIKELKQEFNKKVEELKTKFPKGRMHSREYIITNINKIFNSEKE